MRIRSVAQLMIASVAVLMAMAITGVSAGAAGAESTWSKPQLLYQTNGYTSFPLVAADASGDVHLVFMNLNQRGREVTTSTQGSLLYARLHDGQWSTAADVVVPPGGGPVNLPSMTLDKQGYLHVTFQGGSGDVIYYSRAHVSEAGTARGWSAPQPLSEGAGSYSNISAADDGVLHFVYAGRDGGVHYRRSVDGGQTWSNSITVAGPTDAAGPGKNADYPRVLSDMPGRVHLTWNEYQLPDGWPSVGAFSAQSLDGGQTWSKPRRVAPENYGFVSMVSSQPGVIDRAWNSIGDIGERRHQQSRDGGQTWSPPELINNPSELYSGFTGFPGMAIDSAGILHVVTTLVARTGGHMQIYELTWNGQSWSEPALVSTGVGSATTQSVEESQVTISRGNQVHAVFEEEFGRIWYSTRLLNTPQSPVVSVPDPLTLQPPVSNEATSAPTVMPEQPRRPTPTPQAARPVLPPSVADAPTPTQDPLNGLLLTFIPSLLLVALVLAWRFTR